MEKSVFNTPFNYQKQKGEVNTLPSETVPDQSLSVKDIITRYRNGTLPASQREPNYSEDMPDTRFMDISQIDTLRKENDAYIKASLDDIAQIQKSNLDKATKEKIIAEYEASKKPVQSKESE